MFGFRRKMEVVESENNNSIAQIVIERHKDVKTDFTWEEIHAYNCLIFSNEQAKRYLSSLYTLEDSITLAQAHYAAWLIESKSYMGVSDVVAESLLVKLKKIFIA